MISRSIRTLTAGINNLMSWLLIGFVRIYRLTLSPWLGQQCRFHPTCSNYAIQAIERYGPWRGTAMAVARVFRCNPFHSGGVDDVPVHPDHRLVGDR